MAMYWFDPRSFTRLFSVAVKFLYLAAATGIAAFLPHNIYKLNSLGTHEELISDPEGAYSQLVRLQEGANEGEDARTTDADKSDRSFEITDKATARSMEKMKENGKNNNKKETVQKLAFYKLFMFADKVDVVLMVASLDYVYLAIGAGIASFIRSHDELIKNPMGAYSQLVHLQEGAKEAGKAQVTGVDKSNASSSQMDEEMARPRRGSSSGHHSFGFDVGVASFSIYETQDEEAVEEKSETIY
ncbi:hypothetical protein Dsin_020522 [Dipteronia sinensis]|uniref:Uncharacterized protein n=1 Tax=Dipteronia sinensis TaxID=43782 RepID=A0AAE0AAQ6_9ROSI|nr:hypothetical protein Dsin_020522 [Dipteronia sinensis]